MYGKHAQHTSMPSPRHSYQDTPNNTRLSNKQQPSQSTKTIKLIITLLFILLINVLAIYTAIKRHNTKPIQQYNLEQIEIEEPEPVDETLTLDSGLSIYAPIEFKDSYECKHLEDSISTLVDKGYAVGVYCYDIATGYKLAYNANESIYGASAIKGPYCAYICDTNKSLSESTKNLIYNCVVYSDNDAYESLRKIYGNKQFGEWRQDIPTTDPRNYPHWYIKMSASELGSLWKLIYKKEAELPEGLLECYSKTQHSAIGNLFRPDFTVLSKPGWFPKDENNIPSTTDAGIIYSDCGPYIMVVITDVSSDFTQITPIIDALNSAHGKMCGGSTKSFIQSTK